MTHFRKVNLAPLCPHPRCQPFSRTRNWRGGRRKDVGVWLWIPQGPQFIKVGHHGWLTRVSQVSPHRFGWRPGISQTVSCCAWQPPAWHNVPSITWSMAPCFCMRHIWGSTGGRQQAAEGPLLSEASAWVQLIILLSSHLALNEMAFVRMGQGSIFNGGKTLQQWDLGTKKCSMKYVTRKSEDSYNP